MELDMGEADVVVGPRTRRRSPGALPAPGALRNPPLYDYLDDDPSANKLHILICITYRYPLEFRGSGVLG